MYVHHRFFLFVITIIVAVSIGLVQSAINIFDYV